jgi:hypothetical protein
LIKKIAIFLYLASRSLQRTSKLQENPSAIKKTSITSKIEVLFTILISFYEGHVCPSVSGSESTFPSDQADQNQCGSGFGSAILVIFAVTSRIIKENSNTEMPTLGQRATVQGASPHSQR